MSITYLLNSLWALLIFALHTSALTSMFMFVAFGIWSLHKRFQKFEEWSFSTQLFVLLGVAIFYLIEIQSLSILLKESVVQFIFALLGLLVAGLALYGHIVVSVTSRMLVEVLVPDNPAAATIPRTGPAEALERHQDWEGALNEYYILARMYPRNAMLCIRAANNLVRLNRNEEAVAWFQRAIKYTDKPEDNLAIVRRLCDTLETLNQPEKINEALRTFAERFPEQGDAKSVLTDLSKTATENNGAKEEIAIPDGLVSLADAPIYSDKD